MVLRACCLASCIALLVSGCGRVGVDLLDPSGGLLEGGVRDGEVGTPDVDAAQTGGDASGLFEGGVARDGQVPGGPVDAGAIDDAGSLADGSLGGDAGARDAQVQVPACQVGFADCDSTPLTCETPLGTVTHCARCGDTCPANGGTATCVAGSCGTTCNMTGTFAVKLQVPLNWAGALVAAGSGTTNIWALIVGTQSGNDVVGTIKPCGFTLPDFALAVGMERYRLTFPNSMFDKAPGLPTTPTTLSFAMGTRIGAPFTLPELGVQIGSALMNAVSTAWPLTSGATPLNDMDTDGLPGVTGNYASGLIGGITYSYPAVALANVRADVAYTAARFSFNASGNVSSCNELRGNAPFVRFDTHIVGCHVAGGATCTTTQRDFIDSNRPVFAPVLGMPASLQALRVPAGATCAAARAAIP